MSLVFVIGTGRCGSTMLSMILNDHPDVLSLSEFFTILKDPRHPDEFLTRDISGADLWRRLSSPVPALDEMIRKGMRTSGLRYPYDSGRFSPATGVPLICHGILPMLSSDPDTLFDMLAAEVPAWPARRGADQCHALFRLLAEAGGRRVTVERSGSSLTDLPLLRERFPQARFVHMYRDGADCALSMSRHPASRHAALVAEAARLAGLPPMSPLAEVEAALPHLPPEYTELISGDRDDGKLMARPMPLAAFGDLWSEMVRASVAVLTAAPADSWCGLRYEDLLADPAAELTALAGFLGVPAAPRWLADAGRMTDPGRAGAAARLDPADFAALKAACEPGEQAIAAAGNRRPAAAR
jgi:hypothetical protein